MTLKLSKFNGFFLSFSFLIIAAVLLSSCESSRVGPTLTTPNPPPPAQQSLVLNGFVKDAASRVAISGATVKIVGSNGTILTTILSDNSGKYSFDASNVTESTLNIGASKSGYAFGTRSANINKTANLASVSDILLTKLQVATSTITVVGGGTATTTNTQSVAAQPLTVSVPPNAVSSNVQLTVSSIPAGQLPQPTNTNLAILSAGQFGPTGTQFAQPITITFPLPYTQTPGTVYPLMILNEQTGAYTNSGFSATVNADGTSASAQVTHFTSYILQTAQGEVSVNLGTPSVSTGTSAYKALTSGSTSQNFTVVNDVSVTSTGANQEWLKDEVAGKLNFTIGTSTQTLNFNIQALPSQYIQNGVQVGPAGHENEKGSWEYRWFYALQTTTTNGTATGPNWTANITATVQGYVITNSGWYCISHDQGGAVFGPF